MGLIGIEVMIIGLIVALSFEMWLGGENLDLQIIALIITVVSIFSTVEVLEKK